MPLPRSFVSYRIFLILAVIVASLLSALNLYWSVLLYKIIYDEGKSENEEIEEASQGALRGSGPSGMDRSESVVVNSKRNEVEMDPKKEELVQELSDFVNDDKSVKI